MTGDVGDVFITSARVLERVLDLRGTPKLEVPVPHIRIEIRRECLGQLHGANHFEHVGEILEAMRCGSCQMRV
jgi:hypothetical protein